MDARKRFFAIGFKNHIELRVARKPPTEHKSEACRTMQVEVFPTYSQIDNCNCPTAYNPRDDMYHFAPPKYTEKKEKMIVVYHSGGRVFGTITRSNFMNVIREDRILAEKACIPTNGYMTELNLDQVNKLYKVMNKC
jgi:hypothetical protein